MWCYIDILWFCITLHLFYLNILKLISKCNTVKRNKLLTPNLLIPNNFTDIFGCIVRQLYNQ